MAPGVGIETCSKGWSALMKREEFIRYLESRADELEIPCHGEGDLRGLPREFCQALAVAHLLDALGRSAPSGDDMRRWYGEVALANPEAARWAYRVVGSLQNQDLDKLDVDELLKFWLRFESWGGLAKGLANDLRRRSNSVNSSKDGRRRPPLSQA
jgi:hypothetical protein